MEPGEEAGEEAGPAAAGGEDARFARPTSVQPKVVTEGAWASPTPSSPRARAPPFVSASPALVAGPRHSPALLLRSPPSAHARNRVGRRASGGGR